MAKKYTVLKTFILTGLLMLVFSYGVSALEETIGFTVTGGSFGADDRARVTVQLAMNGATMALGALEAEGVQVAPGYRGKPEIQMREAEYQVEPATDLLLHFNRQPSQEASPHYQPLSLGMGLNNQNRRLGPGAAVFNQDPHGLLLQAMPDSLFAPGGRWQDFSIEFWMYPTTLNEGEQIIAWDGATWTGGKQLPQGIRVEIRDRKLVWDFVNVFSRLAPGRTNDRLVLETERFTLKNKREILPRVWQHHLLRFNARSGLLQYSINGKPEDSLYVTISGHEGGDILQPYIGERSDAQLAIGARYTGFLDELRISRKWVDAPQTDRFQLDGSWVIFNPVDFRDIGVGSKVLRINADWVHPSTSEIAFYYKMTMMPGLITRNDPGWIRFKPGEPITDHNQGQYLYFKVELLADGSGNQGPGLQSLTITYQPDPPPPAPGGVVAVTQDGAVTLRWNPVPVNDIQGYLVYYGTRPGQYFGESASIGISPADVGKISEITIKGLENGRLYYFCIASYNQSNNPVYGIHLKRSLSKEVSARPAR